MATFPFDPSPFILDGCHAIEVQGRPARCRVIHGPPIISNEDLAIVTVIPMPAGQVHFANLKGILQEFFDIKRTRMSSITKCPFGQAYVRFESVTDRDS